MKRAAGSGVLPLLLLTAVRCVGAGGQPGPGATPGAPAQAGSRPQTVMTGTTIDLDPACRLGLGDLAPAAAKVAWWPIGAREKLHLDVSAIVPVNGLIPACGKLYRLLRTGGGAAVIDLDPTALPSGVSMAPDGVTVPISGNSVLSAQPNPVATVRVTVKSVTGAGATISAALDLREIEYRDPGGPPSKTTDRTAEVKVGSDVTAGSSAFKVLNIVPPAAAAGILGWVEFDPRPSGS